MVKRSGGELLFAIAIDRNSTRSITAQVYSAVKQMIVSGDLAVGKRLPSSRTFARELVVSRTTAIAVFERLALGRPDRVAHGLRLVRLGVAEAQRPRAMVTVGNERVATTKLADLIAEASPRFFQRLSHPQKPRAFVTGMPAFDAFPLAVWSRLSAKHWREPRDLIMGYSDPNGLPLLRQAIAEHLRASRGVVCEAEQIFIVNGAQQAFDLIGRVLLNRGDAVWFENPGAIGARNSLIACGARMISGAGRCRRSVRGGRTEHGAGVSPGVRDAVAPAPVGRGDEPAAPSAPVARRQRPRRLDHRGRL